MGSSDLEENTEVLIHNARGKNTRNIVKRHIQLNDRFQNVCKRSSEKIKWKVVFENRTVKIFPELKKDMNSQWCPSSIKHRK